jgi:hypothetical protein
MSESEEGEVKGKGKGGKKGRWQREGMGSEHVRIWSCVGSRGGSGLFGDDLTRRAERNENNELELERV